MNEVIVRCKLACEAEAVAMGFTPELGLDIHDGCVQDDVQDWTDDRFLAWVTGIQEKHGIKPGSDQDYAVMDLYKRCSQIMGDYANLLNH